MCHICLLGTIFPSCLLKLVILVLFMAVLALMCICNCIFSFDHFLKPKIDSKHRFEMKMFIFLLEKKSLRDGQYLILSKNGYQIVF